MAAGALPQFRNRSTEVSRLEGFSDTAFGFAITLLVVSLVVPTRYDQMLDQLRGLPVFAVTFALVASIWYAQYLFFRRYGLDDVVTVILTLLLLFVVLFYVYPLKFLFGVAFQASGITYAKHDIPSLFLIYGVGFAGVSLVLTLMYVNAYRKRKELGLTEWERFVTRVSIADHSATMLVGLTSAGLSQILPEAAIPVVGGYIYFAVAVIKFAAGSYRGRRARALVASARAASTAAPR